GYRDPWRYERLNTVERVLLAKRVPGEPAATARHLNDLLRLRPTAVDRVRGLFETAVKGGDLEAGDRLGTGDRVNELNAAAAGPVGETRMGGPGKPAGQPGGFGGGGRAGGERGEPKSEAADDKPAEGKAQSREQKDLKEAEKRDGATRNKQ